MIWSKWLKYKVLYIKGLEIFGLTFTHGGDKKVLILNICVMETGRLIKDENGNIIDTKEHVDFKQENKCSGDMKHYKIISIEEDYNVVVEVDKRWGRKPIIARNPSLFQSFLYWIKIKKDPRYNGTRPHLCLSDEAGQYTGHKCGIDYYNSEDKESKGSSWYNKEYANHEKRLLGKR